MKQFLEWFKNLRWLTKIALLAVALIIITGGASITFYALSSLSPQVADEGFDVEYIVSGTSKRATISYTNEKGWPKKIETDVPWRWTSPSKAAVGTSLYLSAQARDSGFIKVQIFVDGKLWKEQERFGPFVLATASGYAGDK